MRAKPIRLIFFLAALIGIIYFYRAPLEVVFFRLEQTYLPCARPIAYSIGSFDSRFSITKDQFLAAVKEGEAVWEVPTKRDLFVYKPDGALKINLVYDYRQATTATLGELGIVLKNNTETYTALKERYNELLAAYNAKKTAFDAEVAAYQSRLDAYNNEVNRWNRRGGAPKSTFDALAAEKNELSLEADRIKADEQAVNDLAHNLNAVVDGLNQVAANLNLTVNKYNTVGSARGEEFEEGVYRTDIHGAAIDIYEFDSHQKLVRVLAHELGHALGLGHVNDKNAIMYPLNSGPLNQLTPSDLNALNAKCGSGV